MDSRQNESIAAAALLAAAALGCGWFLGAPHEAPAAALPPATVEHCKRAAALLYDVSWAVACQNTADDSNDCMLPDAEAARVNAILASEEKRCLASEAQASAPH